MNTPDILEAAADYLDANGWTRHDYELEDGACCLIGAINQAIEAEIHSLPRHARRRLARKAVEQRHLARKAVEQQIRHDYVADFPDFYLAEIWNDAQTDRRVVTRLLRRTARTLRKTINPNPKGTK